MMTTQYTKVDPGIKENKTSIECGSCTWSTTGRRRSVIIEPVLAMFYASYTANSIIVTQLVYTILTEENNVTQVCTINVLEMFC